MLPISFACHGQVNCIGNRAPGHLAHAWHARIQTASLNKNHVKHVDTVKRDEDTQWTSQDKQFAHDCFRDFFSASVNRIYIYIYVYIYIMIHINHLYKWAYLKRFNLIQTFTHPVFGGVVGVVVSRLTRATFRNNVHGQSSAVRRRCIFWSWPSNIFWIFLGMILADYGYLWKYHW